MKKLYGLFLALVLLLVNVGSLAAQSQADALAKALSEAHGQTQTGTDSVRVKGVVVDADGKAGMQGAHVKLYTGKDSVLVVTGPKGEFVFPKVPPGLAKLNVSYIGYSSYTMEFKADGVQMDFGEIVMNPGTLELGTATVVTQIQMMTARGDTIVYNPAAFSTMEGDYAVDLIVKFPGIEIEDDGTITAHGETVKWALVDGKLMFGRDVMNTIENVKANDIEEVKVYDIVDPDKPGAEYAKDKEDLQRVMDFSTKSKFTGMLNAQVLGGLGKDIADETDMTPWGRYKMEGNFGLFNDKRIITVNGLSNNTRDGNSEIRRRFMARGRGSGYGGGGDGYGRRNNISMRISNSNPFNDRHKWQGDLSYSFSNSYDNSSTLTERTSLIDGSFRRTINQPRSSSDTHNIGMGIRKRWDNASLNIDPSFSIGKSSSNTYNNIMIDRNETTTTEVSDERSKTNSFSTSGSVSFRQAFVLPELPVDSTLLEDGEEPRRRRPISLSVSAGWSYSKSDNDRLRDYTQIRVEAPDSSVLLSVDNEQRSNGANASVSVGGVEFTPWLVFNTNYSFSHSYSKVLKLGIDELTGEISPGNSETMTHNNVRNSVGAHFSFGKRDSKVSANLSVNYNAVNNMRDEEFPGEQYDQKLFQSITPSFSIGNAQRNMSATKRYQWRVGYNASSSNPSLEQLRNYLDVSEPLYPVLGNPDLKQSYTHNAFASLRISNSEKATSVNINVSGGYTRNSIAQQRVDIDRDTVIMGNEIQSGAELRTYRNVSGARTASVSVGFDRPFIGNKFTFKGIVSYSYAYRPNYEGSELIWNTSHSPSLNIDLRSNHSAVIEYGIRSTTSLGYTFTTGANDFRSVRETLGANFRLRFLKNFTLEGDYAYGYDVNRTGGSQKSDPVTTHLLNGSLSWDFAKRAGSIKFTVYDILNRNSSYTSAVSSQYLTDTWKQLMGRYCMLTASFRINKTYGGQGGGQSMRGPGDGGPGMDPGGPRGGGPGGGGPGGGPRGGGMR